MEERLGGGWAAVIVWIAIQLTLTSLPGAAIPVSIPHPIDWIGHFSMYAILGGLIARVGAFRGWPVKRLVIVALIVSVGGALDEVHQYFIPGRDMEFGDWVFDTLGAAAGIAAGAALMKSRFQKWLR